MNVAITGGTGFVGNAIIAELLQQGHSVRVLVRDGSESKLRQRSGVSLVTGDISSDSDLATLLTGADAVIHLVGIIREFPSKGITFARLHTEATRAIVAAAKASGVSRYLHMSANGSREDAVTRYHKTKWEAEEIVRASGLDWTIFRPSLIYGAEDQFVNMLAKFIRASPVVPVIGDGEYLLQPVSVENVAAGFVAALTKEDSKGKVYHCGGPEPYSYNDILDLIAEAMGKRSPVKIHNPLSLMRIVAGIMENFPFFPVTNGQITMLDEGNVCDPAEWIKEFGIQQKSFKEGVAAYLS